MRARGADRRRDQLRGSGRRQDGRRAALKRTAATSRSSSRTRTRSLNPRMTVGDIVAEPFEIHADVAPQGRPAAARPGAARAGRAQPRARQPLPAPVLRRPAPAHRHRPGAGPAPGGHRLRRAGVGAGRVGAGAGDQPARGPAGRARPGLPLHRARPVGRPPHLRPDRRHVPGQDRRDGHRGRVYDAPRTPTRRRCCRRCRCPTRRCAASGTGSCCRATSRPGRPAVGLPLPHPLLEGAGHLRRPRRRRWSTAARATRPPATSPRRGRSFPSTSTEWPVGSAVRLLMNNAPL